MIFENREGRLVKMLCEKYYKYTWIINLKFRYMEIFFEIYNNLHTEKVYLYPFETLLYPSPSYLMKIYFIFKKYSFSVFK